jgi:hypothetical protein
MTFPCSVSSAAKTWIDQLKWQRLEPFEKLAETLLKRKRVTNPG